MRWESWGDLCLHTHQSPSDAQSSELGGQGLVDMLHQYSCVEGMAWNCDASSICGAY